MRQFSTITKALLCLLLSVSLFSCKEKSPEEIFTDYKKSVVLLRHTYVYAVKNDKGEDFMYFSGFDENGAPANPVFEASEVTPATINGTGFFVDKKGTIVTNRHVAGEIDDASKKRVKIAIKQYFNEYVDLIDSQMDSLNMAKSTLESTYQAYGAALSASEINQLKTSYAEVEAAADTLKQARKMMELAKDSDDTWEIYVKTLHIGYALDGTFAEKNSDFKECVILRRAEEAQVDLAILQAKDQKVPEEVKNIIPLKKDIDPKEDLKVNSKVYMIGYNYGETIANTQKGILAQMNNGAISQETDGYKIMYNIPSLQGSSGSPVFNEEGEVVAVNFAGFQGTQGFNYGVSGQHLAKLLDQVK